MANVEVACLELEDALFKYSQHKGGLTEIQELLHLLRRCVDHGYPNNPPPERLGHEFVRDAMSMVSRIVDVPHLSTDLMTIAELKPIQEQPSVGHIWQRLFPPGTELDLSPFEVDAIIRRRRTQVLELDDEIALLSRRIDRLRSLPVRMQ